MYKVIVDGCSERRTFGKRWRWCARELAVYQRVLRDPRCPLAARILLGAAVAYAVSPIDLIPDFIPILGHLDDAVIVPLLVFLAVRCLPPSMLAEARVAVAGRAAPARG